MYHRWQIRIASLFVKKTRRDHGSKPLHETKFQRFLIGKSVFLNSKFENFMEVEWSEEKFLEGSVCHQARLCF